VTSVPFVDLAPINAVIAERVRSGWDAVLDAGQFVLGAEVDAFEREFADYYGLGHCIGVGNGTDALEIALRALEIGPGDEVIVPAFTFAASGIAVLKAGATPVLVDVDADTLLLDPAAVEAAVGERTAAIMAVNLYGQQVALDAISAIARRHHLALIEDSAQSHGARQHGRLVGDATSFVCTSFYPTKNLGAWGDGGALLTDDPDLATKARLIRNYGGIAKYDHSSFGFNSRLDTIQATVLRAKLPELDRWNGARGDVADAYSSALAGVEGLRLPVTGPGNSHVWHLYVIRVDGRDELLHDLKQRGIGAAVHYPQALPDLGMFDATARAQACPVARWAAATVLSLPLYVGIPDEYVARVVASVRDLMRDSMRSRATGESLV